MAAIIRRQSQASYSQADRPASPSRLSAAVEDEVDYNDQPIERDEAPRSFEPPKLNASPPLRTSDPTQQLRQSPPSEIRPSPPEIRGSPPLRTSPALPPISTAHGAVASQGGAAQSQGANARKVVPRKAAAVPSGYNRTVPPSASAARCRVGVQQQQQMQMRMQQAAHAQPPPPAFLPPPPASDAAGRCDQMWYAASGIDDDGEEEEEEGEEEEGEGRYGDEGGYDVSDYGGGYVTSARDHQAAERWGAAGDAGAGSATATSAAGGSRFAHGGSRAAAINAQRRLRVKGQTRAGNPPAISTVWPPSAPPSPPSADDRRPSMASGHSGSRSSRSSKAAGMLGPSRARSISNNIKAENASNATYVLDKGTLWKFKTFTLFPLLINLRNLDFPSRWLFPLLYLLFLVLMLYEVDFGIAHLTELGNAPGSCRVG